MNKLLLAIALTFSAVGVAYAACSTTTYFINGELMVCTTCCSNGHCTVTCI